MNPQKARELVGNLIERSRRGDYIWRALAFPEGFSTDVDGFVVRIKRSPGLLAGVTNALVLEIDNETGQVVQSITERDLQTYPSTQFAIPVGGGLLDELMRAITGSGADAELAMDKLLKATKLR